MSGEVAAVGGAGSGSTAEASVAHATTAGEEEAVDTYAAPAKVDLATMVAKDAEDESLRKYKASLLGSAASDPSTAAVDPAGRHVVIHEMRIEVEGRAPLVFPLHDKDAVAALEANKVHVKEGATYVIVIVFSVHKDVVLGLRFKNTVYGSMGIPLDRVNQMMGSYPPDGKRNEFRLPPGEWPSGMLARGNYSAKAQFTDDDGHEHLTFNWSFEIKKTWPDGT